MRKIFLLVCLFAACYASAQTSRSTAGIAVQQNRPNALQQRNMQVDPVQTLQKQVSHLQLQVRELRRQLDLLMKDAAAARNSIPKCTDDLLTSSSSSGRRDCAPYLCDSVVGTCLMSCATSNDCSPGNLCDMTAGRCVAAP
jgi:hypothetical protein